MLLLARAQSVSGRPGDAIVMLERLAKAGAVPAEITTSEDFAAVRAHRRWDEVRKTLFDGPVQPSAGAGVAEAPATAKRTAAAPPTPAEKLTPPPVATPKPEVPKSVPAERPVVTAAEAPKASAAKTPGRLAFTTLLSPSALAYDAVSKRYLIADRQARRVAVVDENTGQVSTLAGAAARLGEINGIAIDVRQGDLWVVSTAPEGASLARLQLISGRELRTARITGITARVIGTAFVRGAGVVVADARGDLWRVPASGKAVKIGSLEYVPRAIAADPDGTLYITAGGPRIARFSVAPTFRRLGVVDVDDAMIDAPFAVTADRIHLVVPSNGAYEIRTIKK